MNLIHKTIWNPARQQYIATSELAAGHARSVSAGMRRGDAPHEALRIPVKRLCAALVAAGLCMPGAALPSTCDTGGAGQSAPVGGTCALPFFNPPASSDGVGGAVVGEGETVTLTGAPSFGTGYTGNTTVPAYTVPAVSGTFDTSALVTGPQTLAVTATNAATGTTVVYRAFDSSGFADRSNIDTPVNQYEDVDGDQYIHASIGSVQSSGGTLEVNVGADPAGAPSANGIMLTAKQTYLTSADGTGEADSRVVWRSRNAIDMGIDPGLPTPDEDGRIAVQVPVTTYAGTVVFGGTAYTVTNAAELAVYNDALVAALRSGELTSQDAYDQAFGQAFTNTLQTVVYQTDTTAGDLARTPVGDSYAILADGARGSALIAAGAQIDMTRASGAVKAANGATVVNDGTLSGHVIRQVVQVESGAHFVNGATGVVASGYQAGDRLDTATQETFYYTGSGIVATGAGTTVQNSGIIDVAGFAYPDNTSVGLALRDGASGNNDGIIDVGVNPGFVTRVVGVEVSGASAFTNATDGTIYIGRAAQYAPSDPAADVAIAGPSYGIRILDTGDTATNAGRIVIGTQAQNAVAMYSTAPLVSTLLNTGTISIEGAAAGVPLANIGMLADDNGTAAAGSVVRNAGTIDVSGVNGIGIKVNADPGIAANAESTGTINVDGHADPASGTRNFGMWVDGAQAQGRIAGALNLTGDGAIGLFAQDGGAIVVADGAAPRFLAGTEQIGFYASGAGSAIHVDAAALEVGTARSTLFRVADGAAYTGSSTGGAFDLTVSGTDARGVVATGAGTTLSTGASVYRVTGAAGTLGGAVAIVDEGGAGGVIDAGTTIELGSAGATAAIVDGQAHDLAGAAVGNPVATTLVNRASIQSGAEHATGFVARDLGTLVNEGSVFLSGAASTGVIVDSQGTVLNAGTIRVADGEAARVQGAGAQLINTGTIQADGGTAAIHLGGTDVSLLVSGTGQVRAAGHAIDVDGGQATISVQDGAAVSAASGVLLNAANASVVDFHANGVVLAGDMLADGSSTVAAALQNGTSLAGRADGLSMNVDRSSTWTITASSAVTSLDNAGAVAFTAPTADPTLGGSYKTLSAGAYAGSAGTIALNAYLASDDAPSDRLVLRGGAATGSTGLRIVNTGGPGMPTTADGINVVTVADGGTTAPDAFHLSAPVQSGAYEYLLYRGGSADPDGYYLRSNLGGAAARQAGSPAPIAYRPAVPAYAMTPALNMDYGFLALGRLHDRVGDIASVERGQPAHRDGVWGRVIGRWLDAASNDRFTADQRVYAMQFGKDWTLPDAAGDGKAHAGVTVSIGSADATFGDELRGRDPALTNRTGTTDMQAQSIGGYFTKYAGDGSYWDSVVQFTRYRNKYDDVYGERARQHGLGVAVSQEIGKPFPLAGGVYVEPQAQLSYQYLKLDGFDDAVSEVSGSSSNAVRGRLGARVFVPDVGNPQRGASGTPYLTVDVLHDFMPAPRATVGDTVFRGTMGRTWAELGVGISAGIGKSGEFYATAMYAKNIDGENRRMTYGQIGYRYSW
ncbi:hypothetical protein GCM10023144_18280 [Pigmentiphaga soli]|uniref:Autotransporter domain-containing protein n=1 Tax=Pigmentiphaga soli TaxID=1007095 RepID=A0ABP8GVD3_9BURK